MIFLSGDIGALMTSVLLIGLFFVFPIILLISISVSKTKFYINTIKNRKFLVKLLFYLVLLILFLLLLLVVCKIILYSLTRN